MRDELFLIKVMWVRQRVVFYWRFCVLGLEERWKMVKIGGFRDDSEFGI